MSRVAQCRAITKGYSTRPEHRALPDEVNGETNEASASERASPTWAARSAPLPQ